MVRGTWLTRARLDRTLQSAAAVYDRSQRSIDAFFAAVQTEGAAKAIRHYRTALVRPEPWRIPEPLLLSAGRTPQRAGNPKDAEALIRFAASINPHSWRAWDILAGLEAQRDRNRAAAADYRRSFALNPKNSDALNAAKKLEGNL
jgi:Flp pilus assembly protein TadD